MLGGRKRSQQHRRNPGGGDFGECEIPVRPYSSREVSGGSWEGFAVEKGREALVCT